MRYRSNTKKLYFLSFILLFSLLNLIISPVTEAKLVTTPDTLHDYIFDETLLSSISGSIDGTILVNPLSLNLYFHNSTGLYTSSDNGDSWTSVRSPIANFRSMYYTDGGILLIQNGTGAAGQIFRSIDNGVTITSVMSLNSSDGWMNLWNWESYNSTLIFVGEYDSGSYNIPKYVYRSTDAGLTWGWVLNVSVTYNDLLGDIGDWYGHIHKIGIDTYDDMVWVSVGDDASNRTMFYSDDFGDTWNTFGVGHLNYGMPERPLGIVCLEDRVIFGDDSDSDAGFVYMKDSGRFYQTFDGAVHHFWSLEEHNNVVYAGTHHDGEVNNGLWVTVDGWSWYWLFDTHVSGSSGITISDRNDGEYFYFTVSSMGTYRARLLTSDEAAYLLRESTVSGILVDGNEGYNSTQSFSVSGSQNFTLTVTGVNRTNLLSNAGFETNTDPGTLPDDWSYSGSENCTFEWASDDPPEGSRYLIHNHNQTDDNVIILRHSVVDNLSGTTNYLLAFDFQFNGTALSGGFPETTGIWANWEPVGGGPWKGFHSLTVRTQTLYWIYTSNVRLPPTSDSGRVWIWAKTNRDLGAFTLDKAILEQSDIVEEWFRWIESGEHESENIEITIINGAGESEVFNVGTLTNGGSSNIISSISPLGYLDLETSIDGSRIANFSISMTPEITVSNCLLTGLTDEIYYGISYNGLTPSVTTSITDRPIFFLERSATPSGISWIDRTLENRQILTLTSSIPEGVNSSILEVYCSELNQPEYIEGVDSWSYNATTTIATVNIAHSSDQQVVVVWSNYATYGHVLALLLIILMIIAPALTLIKRIR